MNQTPTLHNRQARRLSYVYYNASCFYRFLDFVFLRADTRSAPTYYALLFSSRNIRDALILASEF